MQSGGNTKKIENVLKFSLCSSVVHTYLSSYIPYYYMKLLFQFLLKVTPAPPRSE